LLNTIAADPARESWADEVSWLAAPAQEPEAQEDPHGAETWSTGTSGRSGDAAGIGRALRGPLLGPRLRGRFSGRPALRAMIGQAR
jgi:hypothetical protein